MATPQWFSVKLAIWLKLTSHQLNERDRYLLLATMCDGRCSVMATSNFFNSRQTL